MVKPYAGALVGLVVAVLTVVGCGSDRPEAEPKAEARDLPVTPSPNRVTCGGEGGVDGWPVSAMDGGIVSRHSRSELRAALKEDAEASGIDAPAAFQENGVDGTPWFVLAETDKAVTVAIGSWSLDGPDEDGETITFEKQRGRWGFAYGGGCNLAPELGPGLGWVEVQAAPDLDSTSADLSLLVSELACSSGRDPLPFLRPVSIDERRDSVTISLTVPTPPGANTCIGSNPSPYVVHLDQPLGDRVLLDGSTWPARPITSD